MARGGLGAITISMGLDAAEFVTNLNRSEREAARAAKKIEKEISGAANAIRAGFAGITIAATFTKFIQETVDAQNEAAQLTAVLRSTGQAAGYGEERLNAMAQALSQNSIFSDGDITKAQTRLLSYTNVVGEQFPEAMQAAIDMASRMGIDVTSAAETVGKALDVPSQGLSALSKQGFRFTEEEEKLVKALEKAGRTAEAQGIVLKALETSYGGAAREARDTLGGALAGLKNEFDSLMTGEGGNVVSAKVAIEDLTKTLGSSETKEAFQSAIQAMATLVGWAVTGANEFVGFGKNLGEALARGIHGSADPIGDRIKTLQLEAKQVQFSIEMATKATDGGREKRLENLRAQAERVDADLAKLRAQLPTGNVPSSGTLPAVTVPGNRTKPVIDISDKEKITDAQRYMESLRKQLMTAQELSVVETALQDIQAGRLGTITPKQRELVLSLAGQIDKQKELKELQKQDEDIAKFAQDYTNAVAESNLMLEAEVSLIGQTVEQKKQALDQLRIQLDLKKKIAEIDKLGGTQAARDKATADVISAAEQEKATLQTRQFIEQQEKIAADAQKVWDNFRENVQRNMGDQFYNILQGNFDSVGDAFKSMVMRMVADAAAANLTQALMGGAGASGGMFGGLLSLGLGMFGGGASAANAAANAGAVSNLSNTLGSGFYGIDLPSFDVGTDFVPNDMIAKIHKGERILTAAENRNFTSKSGAPVVQFSPVYQVDSRSDRAAIMQDLQRMSKQTKAELVEELSRSRVI